MDNRKKKRNKQKNRQNSNPNTNTKTEVLNTEAEEKKTEEKKKAEEKAKAEEKKKAEEKIRAEEKKKAEEKIKAEEKRKAEEKIKAEEKTASSKADQKTEEKKTEKPKNSVKPEPQKAAVQQEGKKVVSGSKEKDGAKKEDTAGAKRKKDESKSKKEEAQKAVLVDTAKVLLPVAACALIIAVVISFISQRNQKTDSVSLNENPGESAVSVAALGEEPLAENAVAEVNELMQRFCTAMADGDMDTVKAIKDYNTDKEIITYKEKSEFIERYENIQCYTKHGMEENSYFVYVTYDVKFKDIETEAPGLNAFYVYTAEDGSLKIDGDTEENVKAAFKLVTSQDDVVDLYNEINVRYTEATASDEALNQFMEELPATIRSSVGVALAQLETQDGSGETSQTEAEAGEIQPAEAPGEELPQNQTVDQIVRTTDTVNVRSSDSEEADKIGKAQAGTEIKRTEIRVNGWSKVVFEDREAFIKSDYLEVVSDGTTAAPESIGAITAMTNVNVRSQASQESERLGTAQAGNSYTLLEDQGEWYKIDYNGTTGFVKAEFFLR